MDNYLYKTRMSLINLDVFLMLILSCVSFFVNIWCGVLACLLLFFWCVFIIGTRIYVYQDKVVYKVGFFLKTSVKILKVDTISMVSYSNSLFGKIFNYGDVIISSYNENSSFSLKGMKNAKMLCENICELINKKK